MSKLAKALTAAAGNAGESLYIEDVFSTYLYTGNGTGQTITNDIDLSGEGGLVWMKDRTTGNASVGWNTLVDTERGGANQIWSNSTSGQVNLPSRALTFNSNGFSVSADIYHTNRSGDDFASFTFRKAEKFFDCLTYTGNGSGNRIIPSSLGSRIGAVIIKRTDSSAAWSVTHRKDGTAVATGLSLNTSSAALYPNTTNATFDNDGGFNVGNIVDDTGNGQNVVGGTYVAYLFASDAGGFGDDGSENIIKCGSFDANLNEVINLGWEPQWILFKPTSTGNWRLVDNMRGWTNLSGTNAYTTQQLLANATNAEFENSFARLTSTGFEINQSGGGVQHIYIAIRRPMKTPESGTEVYTAVSASTSPYPTTVTSGFPVDMVIMGDQPTTWGYNWSVSDRLRGGSNVLFTSSTAAENTGSNTTLDSNTGLTNGWVSGGTTGIFQMFKRATGFMDMVAFSGSSTLSERTYNHNLGVQPELIIIKGRSGSYGSGDWNVATNQGAKNGESIDTTKNHTGFQLNATNGITFGTSQNWSDVCSTTTFTTNGAASYITNSSGNTIQWSAGTDFISYLFATLAGVSKVGSYTGTGSDLNVDCGFSAGARFILIKRTDSTGDWYVWDSERGIVAGNDPYLLLNSTAAEVTSTDYIDPLSSGFTVTSSAPAALNASGGTYIFLAIS